MPSRHPIFWRGIFAVAGAKLLLHLYANTIYGFHRDEFLYLALGKHLDWGYWSNPPLIGGLGWLAGHLAGGELWAIRLLPTLAGCGLVVLAGAMARELGGGRYAQFLAAFAVLVSPAYLRSAMLFQPVIFDILGWTVLCYLLIRYLNTENRRYLLGLGLAFGITFLNKYMVLIWLAALFLALLLVPFRRVLRHRGTWQAAGLALLVMAPNLIWQYVYHFPVVQHMRELSEYQLVNVRASDFLRGQLLMNLTAGLVWIPGLWYLWRAREGAYRVLFFLFAGVILTLLMMHGKTYYSLGIYPMLIAAGGAFWENTVKNAGLRAAIPVAMAGLLLPVLPLAIPVYPPVQMAAFCRWATDSLGIDDTTRWEDGEQHPLPQDYADMLGWPELGQAAVKAYRLLPPGTPVLLYGENYGQAGAVDYFGRHEGLPPAVSFSDSYLLWVPEKTDAQALIYINDELGEDVRHLFADIQPVGSITDTLAREYGTTVYLCREPRVDLDSFWRVRVREVQAEH